VRTTVATRVNLGKKCNYIKHGWFVIGYPLHGGSCLSSQVLLDSEKFGLLAWRWIFGVLLTGALESLLAEDAHCTDLGLPKEQVKELALRTAQFDHILGGTRCEDVSNAGLNAAFVRLRSTIGKFR
ncbi:unnamed protein product, partial [Durusdinium trenchii]